MEEYLKQNSVRPIIYLQSVGSVGVISVAQLGQRLSLHLLEEHFLRHDVETNVISDNTL